MKRTVTTTSEWFVLREGSLIDFIEALNKYVKVGWIPHPESYQLCSGSCDIMYYSILVEKVIEQP